MDMILSRFITFQKHPTGKPHESAVRAYKVQVLGLPLEKKQKEINTSVSTDEIYRLKRKLILFTLLLKITLSLTNLLIYMNCCPKRVIKKKKPEFTCEKARLLRIYLISRRGYF